MNKKILRVVAAALLMALVVTGCAGKENSQKDMSTHEYAKGLVKPREGQKVKNFSLTAKESSLQINEGLVIPVWTFNGRVPGTEIRVTQGDFVRVELKNELKEPVTIHWHGYPVMAAMDGVPGISQDAVRPGEAFTYEFSADVPGTYWYHSHQESAKQVDKGLYGAFIVEPQNKGKVDKEYTLILDEWMENQDQNNSHTGGVSGHGGSNSMMSEEEMMSVMYNIYTVNGKSGKLIPSLDVQKGDVIRLRLINAGYRSHGIHVPGQDMRVVSTDGQEIVGAGVIKDKIISIAPGERYDVEFAVASDENFIIDAHDENLYNDQLRIPVNVAGAGEKFKAEPAGANYSLFDLTGYGKPGKGQFTLEQKYDIDYYVELDTKMSGHTQVYTINGKTFDELPPLRVKTGDTVKFTFENKSSMNHPMHLHGHFFEILAKNGSPVMGAAIRKDTLQVKPGEKYVVAFKADNPGDWVQHCHELHHAAAGMMQRIDYVDFVPNYSPDPKNKFNRAE